MNKTVAFNPYNVVYNRFDNNILDCNISYTSINIRTKDLWKYAFSMSFTFKERKMLYDMVTTFQLAGFYKVHITLYKKSWVIIYVLMSINQTFYNIKCKSS